MLLTRILTALALIPLVVAAVLWLPQTGLAVLIALVVTGSAWEWAQFAVTDRKARAAYAAALGMLVLLLPTHSAWALAMIGLAFWAVIFVWLLAYPRGFTPGVGQWPLRLGVGGVVMVLFGSSALAMAPLPDGRLLILITLVVVWAMDVGGYFAGKQYGRRKLARLVSPNKSWEGFFGGVVLATIVAFAAAGLVLSMDPRQGLIFMALCLAVGAGSVLGDLCESMFKRQAGIKDSGSLLPGHGGLLDRLDSTYAAMPLMLAGWLLIFQ